MLEQREQPARPRPTQSSDELTPEEFDDGIDELNRKVRDWRPGLILFVFKEPAKRLFGSRVTPGLIGSLEDVPAFLLSGPYAPAAEAERVDTELRSLLERAQPTAGDHEWTQRVTAKDLERGQIRLRQPARRFFPAGRCRIEVVLRGERVDASYDPKVGADRNRSPVLQIGRERLESVVDRNEELRVSRGLGGVAQLD